MSLEWTGQSPRAGGYYWFLDVHDFDDPKKKPEIVRVRDAYENEPLHVTGPSFYVDFLQQAQSQLLKEKNGCWYGPITMPEYRDCRRK